MKSVYRQPLFCQLRDDWIRGAMRNDWLSLVGRADAVLGALGPESSLAYDFFHERILGQPSQAAGDVFVSVAAAQHDLSLLVEEVTGALAIPEESVSQPLLAADELAAELHVAPKTIARWQSRGLIGCRVVVHGRTVLRFLRTSVDRFVSQNEDRVRRSGQFGRLTDKERGHIVEAARRLLAEGLSKANVLHILQLETGRCAETVRTLIRRDETSRAAAAVSLARDPEPRSLDEEIYQGWMQGETVGELARRFGCTPQTVGRTLRKVRAQRIQELPLKYCFSSEFLDKDAGTKILGPPPDSASKTRKMRPPTGLPAYLASLYEIPLLSAVEERHLFRKFNYLKYLADGLRQGLRREDPNGRLLAEIERLYAEAIAIKNTLVSSNLRLVVSFAKRDLTPRGDLFELISDGNLSLMRAVDRFDYVRGFKFSTYASWAIRKNFARDGSNRKLHHARFRTGFDDSFGHRADVRTDPYQEEAAHRHRVFAIRRLLRHLTDREQRIIKFRFGLRPGSQPRTFQEVGRAIGVSKERARQLTTRAICKLRLAAEREPLDGPAP